MEPAVARAARAARAARDTSGPPGPGGRVEAVLPIESVEHAAGLPPGPGAEAEAPAPHGTAGPVGEHRRGPRRDVWWRGSPTPGV